MGSPPQVRGKLAPTQSVSAIPRITPAGAGKTFKYLFTATLLMGSPPQVRGKRDFPFPLFDGLRITPAGAGKTELDAIIAVAVEDHPRRCGENLYTSILLR